MSELMQQLANVAIGGILALLILREVFDFIRRKSMNGSGRRDTGPSNSPSNTAIVDRLDRIIDRLDDLASVMKTARRQTEVNGEQQDMICRQLTKLERTLGKIEQSTRHRPSAPIPLQP